MVEIKPSSGVQPPITPEVDTPAKAVTPLSTNPVAAAGAAEMAPVLNPEAVAKALKDYQKLRDQLKNKSFKGAASIFADNVVFPNELLDPNNPANDPRYLHLLLAMFGLKEMKQFFDTDEQRAEDEEIEKKNEASEREKNVNPVRKKPDSRSPKS